MEINFKGKIGFEIECIAKNENVNALKDLCAQLDYRYGYDGSINGYDRQKFTSQEIVSKVYNLSDIKQALLDIDKILKGVKVNESCGLHMHISFEKMTHYYQLLCWKFVQQFQTQYDLTFTKPKEQARKTRNYSKFYMSEDTFLDTTKKQLTGGYRDGSRYQCINYNSYTKYKTIEFRIFAATNKITTFKKNVKFLLETINSFLQTAQFKEITFEKKAPKKPETEQIVIKEILTQEQLKCAI